MRHSACDSMRAAGGADRQRAPGPWEVDLEEVTDEQDK